MENNVRLVPEGSRVGDVGCDHGYASIYLCERKRCRVIALDINAGPLRKAAENIERAGLAGQIECRLSDGLEKLAPGEVDALLIAGMGGMLTVRILENSPAVLERIDTLVLQPQSDIGEVRRAVVSLGFSITGESVCLDAGKYYIAIQAARTAERDTYTEVEYAYGRFLPERGDRLYRQYLLAEGEKTERIIEKLKAEGRQAGPSRHMEERIRELSHTLEQINQTLSGFKLTEV